MLLLVLSYFYLPYSTPNTSIENHVDVFQASLHPSKPVHYGSWKSHLSFDKMGERESAGPSVSFISHSPKIYQKKNLPRYPGQAHIRGKIAVSGKVNELTNEIFPFLMLRVESSSNLFNISSPVCRFSRDFQCDLVTFNSENVYHTKAWQPQNFASPLHKLATYRAVYSY